MKIIALDLSLTASGYATHDVAGVITPPRTHDRGIPRLAWIRSAIMNIAAGFDLAVVEGYSYGQRAGSSHSHALGELGGVVRLALWENGIRIVDVAPSSLKRFATGKGNAGKELVLVDAVKRLGYDGADNNVADALWLRAMALVHYGLEGAPQLPAAHRAALNTIAWPVVNTTNESSE